MKLEDRRGILRSLDFDCVDFETEHGGRDKNLTQLQRDEGIADVAYDRQMATTGDDLAQQFESLSNKIGRLSSESAGT